MVEKKPVSVGIQVIFCIIPYLWIYGFYRIEKLRLGLVIVIITFAASVGLQMALPFPWGITASIIISGLIPIAFMVKWSREWNESVSNYTDEKEGTPNNSLEILKERYAKGEITKEEFDKMKEDLS